VREFRRADARRPGTWQPECNARNLGRELGSVKVLSGRIRICFLSNSWDGTMLERRKSRRLIPQLPIKLRRGSTRVRLGHQSCDLSLSDYYPGCRLNLPRPVQWRILVADTTIGTACVVVRATASSAVVHGMAMSFQDRERRMVFAESLATVWGKIIIGQICQTGVVPHPLRSKPFMSAMTSPGVIQASLSSKLEKSCHDSSQATRGTAVMEREQASVFCG
jgi:hypothetical protein